MDQAKAVKRFWWLVDRNAKKCRWLAVLSITHVADCVRIGAANARTSCYLKLRCAIDQ